MSPSSPTPGPTLEELVEEFASRREAGEALSVESFAAAHPAHAERLRKLLPTLCALDELD